MSDLNEIIENAVTDAETTPEPTTPDTNLETTPEVVASPEAPEAPSEPIVEETTTSEVSSPGNRDAAGKFLPKGDEFEKKFGVKATSEGGRENRIPYSRVKKIALNAEKEGKTAAEATFAPKIKEYETKITDYEGRLTKVAEFEDILMNKADVFLQMLSQIPAYKPFFDKLAAQSAAPEAQAAPQAVPDDMPQPNQELSDGTKVYDLDGLKALNAWNRAQARKEVMEEVEKRYAPMENQWQANQKLQAIIPQVQKQIDEARTWPLFNDSEPEIIKALQADGSLTLERAYQKVVMPKLQADRTKMREEILKEVRQAPRSTSAPSTPAKSTPDTSTGPRTLEDVIADSVAGLKR
jgi:hypothetical protein